jgi:sugar phosphate isomerase/epimerase
VALIGSGRMGAFHGETLARRVRGARLVAVADPAPDVAERLADAPGAERGYTDPAEVLADPAVEAVVIAAPARFHADLVVAAAGAGRAVFCEKPMALTLAAARAAGVVLQVGFNRRAGRVFTLENLNTALDHPGTPFARAADTLALVEAVGSPHLRMNLDLYHAQIGEGNLIQLVQRALPLVGEIQVADVPGRCEPGTGEINYPAVAAALDRLGYAGVVGLEAWASGDPLQALERFRAAFTVPAR